MKKRLLVIVAIIMMISTISISAGSYIYDYEFSGRVGYSGAYVDTDALKDEYGTPYIEWDECSYTTINMWFSVRDSQTDQTLRKVLFLASDMGQGFGINNCPTVYGKRYDLFANREHLFDVTVPIAGTWKP